MTSVTDSDLLRRFVAGRSEPAFALLVERHLSLVYGTALRLVGGDAALAQDVSQSVFADLARKSSSLLHHGSLAGWLHTSTRFASAKAVRAETRRRQRESAFAAMQTHDSEPAGAQWEELAPMLDETIACLPGTDREAILLRFLGGKTFSEIGATLGLTENAARMRTDRALEKLRALFAQRGIPVSAITLAALLPASAQVAVPLGLAASVSQSALAAAVTTTPSLLLTQLMASTKLKTSLAVLALAGLTIPFIVQTRKPPAAPAAEPAPPALRPTPPLLESNETAPSAAVPTVPVAPAQLTPVTSPSPQETRALAGQVPETSPALASDPIASAPFRASIKQTLQPGEMVVTGGWATAPGKRTFVFITPKVEQSDSGASIITIAPRLIEAQESVWSAIGFERIVAHQAESTLQQRLNSDLAAEVIQALKEVIPDSLRSSPRIATMPGQESKISIGGVGAPNSSTMMSFIPTLENDGSISLESRIGLGANLPEPDPVPSIPPQAVSANGTANSP